MRKIIAFRLSAMGDVVLTVPAIKGVLEANPDLEITLVTRKFFAPFFYGIPHLRLFFPELKSRHKGLIGLFKLFSDLKKEAPFEAAIDLHGVIRTRIISFLFKISGTSVFSIDKGRKEKKLLIKTKNVKVLKHTTERYLDTFVKAGFMGQIGISPYLIVEEKAQVNARQFLDDNKINTTRLKIGLAPFATLAPKIWGIQNIRELVTLINAEHDVEFFLFGGGSDEIRLLKEFQQFSPNIHLVAGKLELSEELALIGKLDLMITMDSSNMHLSALSGIPTISIWGGTHPAFGFYALGQPADYHIQTPVSTLKCRPCSVFGNKPCIYPTPRCMEMVTPQHVLNTLLKSNLLGETLNTSQQTNHSTESQKITPSLQNLILITPVKDSLKTTREIISSLRASNQDIPYYIFDDFSSKETRRWLEEHAVQYGYRVIGLEKHIKKSSPNYRTTLILAQKIALEQGSHLAIVESDVFASHETIAGLYKLADELSDAGLVGSVTVDTTGEINFPYAYATAIDKPDVFASAKSVSFCCTVLSHRMLKKFDFNELPQNLDWFDVFISRKSKQLGFSNYVVKNLPVVHKPHSSRPWKNLKYKNPILYYLKKIIKQRDRI